MKIYSTYFRFCTCLLFALLFCSSNVNSQEFAPIGATWVYQNKLPEWPDFPVLVRFTSDRDTIINGKDARIIEREELYLGGEWKYFDYEIVTSTGDSVFVYQDEEFKLIFDYTKEAGDTLVVVDKPFEGFFFDLGPVLPKFKHFKYRIDSVVNEAMGDDILIKQYVSYIENPYDTLLQWGFQSGNGFAQSVVPLGKILEGVGSLGFDSPLGSTPNLSSLANVELQELTCYSDKFKTINFMGIDCDSLVEVFENSSSVTENDFHRIKIYPNPFSSDLKIEGHTASSIEEVLLFDKAGNLVAEYHEQQMKYDLSHLIPGIYFLRVASKNRIHQIFKIQKI